MTKADATAKPIIGVILGGMQVVMILLYAFVAEYSDIARTKSEGVETKNDLALNQLYPFFQDVHVMVFVGFGFLMTFAKRYSLSAVGFNMLIASSMLQWTILVVGFWHRVLQEDFSEKIQLDVTSLVSGDFGAAAVLISFGAVLGKAGPVQLVVMGIIEIIFYGLNESIGYVEYESVDMGGSMYVHMFGAFFGIAASYSLMSNKEVELRKNGADGSTPTTDTFAMIGTLFLWMFWPSFNGALATGASRNRVVINTVLAIAASCTAAFSSSYVFRRSGRFSMVDIQNATLAGGVAVGSSSDMVVDAWPAMLLGFGAGIVSVLGYCYLQPALAKIGLHDTCGVLNLHGLPGLIGAVSGCISAAAAGDYLYGEEVGKVFPARKTGRSASYQGAMQAACLFTTLGISLASGLLAGFLMKQLPDTVDGDDRIFEDSKYWEIEEDEERAVNDPAVEEDITTKPFP